VLTAPASTQTHKQLPLHAHVGHEHIAAGSLGAYPTERVFSALQQLCAPTGPHALFAYLLASPNDEQKGMLVQLNVCMHPLLCSVLGMPQTLRPVGRRLVSVVHLGVSRVHRQHSQGERHASHDQQTPITTGHG
jgi:hypothetical protein